MFLLCAIAGAYALQLAFRGRPQGQVEDVDSDDETFEWVAVPSPRGSEQDRLPRGGPQEREAKDQAEDQPMPKVRDAAVQTSPCPCTTASVQTQVRRRDVQIQGICTYTSLRRVTTPRFLPLPDTAAGVWRMPDEDEDEELR